MDDLNPEWDEIFTKTWEMGDEPVLLIFDVWDWDDAAEEQDIAEVGDHLGSGYLMLWDLPNRTRKKKKLELLGESQLLETLLMKDGNPSNSRAGNGGEERKQTAGALGGGKLGALFQ